MEIIIEEEISKIFQAIYDGGIILEALAQVPQYVPNIKKSISEYRRAISHAQRARKCIENISIDDRISEVLNEESAENRKSSQKNPFPDLASALKVTKKSILESGILEFPFIVKVLSDLYEIDLKDFGTFLGEYVTRTRTALEGMGEYAVTSGNIIETSAINFQPLEAAHYLAYIRLNQILEQY